MPTSSLSRWYVSLLDVVVDVSLALHLSAAAVWWWFSPKGFPIASSQYWTNSVLPATAMVLASIGLIAMHKSRRLVAAAIVLCFAAAWAAAAIASRIVFPISLAGVWSLFFAVACAGGAMFVLLVRGKCKLLPCWTACAAIGVSVGILVVRWQIPEPPSTVPWDFKSASADDVQNRNPSQSIVQVTENADFHPGAVAFTLRQGDVRINCSPLIEFDRISPDHFWSLLAGRQWTQVRRFVQQTFTEDAVTFHYNDGSTVVVPKQPATALELSAYTSIKMATYSHLNTFCYLELGGHKSLALSFSPCSDAIVDVLPADYPFGRPARFAYLDAVEQFHVCEATSGEKGPFHILTSGPLKRDEPLTIGIHDNGRRIASITLDDWSAQASTALSPTAGWGVPVNAVEFQRLGDSPTDRVGVWITLAATSVGRGFDTVGYRPGTYRNRIAVRLEPTSVE
jgi:hypothetical protein